jgi:hypothetical protein
MVRAAVKVVEQPVKMVCIAAAQGILVLRAVEVLLRLAELPGPIGVAQQRVLRGKEVQAAFMAVAAAAVGSAAAVQATVEAEEDPTTRIQIFVPTLPIPVAPAKGMALLP